MHRFALFALACSLIALAAASCGGGTPRALVTIEPLATSTARSIASFGGKPATPFNAVITSEPSSPTAAPSSTTQAQAEAPGATAEAPSATATPDLAPTEGRWIDVDVSRFSVRLMDGRMVLREIGPIAVGAEVDTGAYASTQTGLFHVYNKVGDLTYDAPYNTYISDWVGFDPDKANGFHSFLKDKEGRVVDASIGRVSNGCIRTGAGEAVFAFAEIGMPVWVHS